MKFLCCVAAVVFLGALGGCGGGAEDGTATGNPPAATTAREKPPKKKLRLLEITIDGYPNPDYAGLFLANQRGYFEDAGLELSIHTPILPRRPIPYVVEEAVELGVTHEPEAILARERGAPIIAVGALLRQPTTSLVWLRKTPIRGIADLKGKTIATEGLDYQERFLEALLGEANLTLADVKVMKKAYRSVPALEDGKVDAIIGVGWNVEGPQMRAEGFHPIVVPVADWGIGGYDELVMVARRDRLGQIGDRVHDFLVTLAKGNRAAENDPRSAARVLARENRELPEKAIAEGLEDTLPMLSKTGLMNPAHWRRFAARMQAAGMAEDPPPVSQLLTNEYVR